MPVCRLFVGDYYESGCSRVGSWATAAAGAVADVVVVTAAAPVTPLAPLAPVVVGCCNGGNSGGCGDERSSTLRRFGLLSGFDVCHFDFVT